MTNEIQKQHIKVYEQLFEKIRDEQIELWVAEDIIKVNHIYRNNYPKEMSQKETKAIDKTVNLLIKKLENIQGEYITFKEFLQKTKLDLPIIEFDRQYGSYSSGVERIYLYRVSSTIGLATRKYPPIAEEVVTGDYMRKMFTSKGPFRPYPPHEEIEKKIKEAFKLYFNPPNETHFIYAFKFKEMTRNKIPIDWTFEKEFLPEIIRFEYEIKELEIKK